MSAEVSAVRQATAEDIEGVVAPLVVAFATDPFVRWVFAEPRQYLTYFPQLMRIHIGRVLGDGGVHQTTDSKASALWFSPNTHPDVPALMRVFEEAFDAPSVERVFSVLQQMGAYEPAEPHWYLRSIGVDPASQGRGYAKALLEYGLRKCDREGMPAYLEASGERSIGLYQRFGFKVLGKIQVADAPPLWPMLREPAG